MKLGSRRGATAVLEAPEEDYALGSDEVAAAGWEPAPAGALQRSATGAFAEPVSGRAAAAEEEYVPRRGRAAQVPVGLKLRLRAGLPKSITGKVVTGAVVALGLGVFVVTAVGVKHSLLHDDRFAIATSSEIEITGNQHLTRSQVLSVFGADLERNIFKIPLAERRSDLERLPWVAHATVMRLLPNHLRVAITERTPVAFARQGSELGLVDANGVLLDMPPDAAGDPHYSFPVLTGLSASDPLSVRAARMAVYLKFMKDLSAGGKSVTDSLSEVDVSNPEDVKAIVNDVLVHFGDEQFLTRYQEFEQHLPQWKAQYPKLASADMRYERQVVLEMAQGSNALTGQAPASADGSAPVAGAAAPVAPVVAPTRPAASRVRAVAPAKSKPVVRKSVARRERRVDARHRRIEQLIQRARATKVANTVALPSGGGAR